MLEGEGTFAQSQGAVVAGGIKHFFEGKLRGKPQVVGRGRSVRNNQFTAFLRKALQHLFGLWRSPAKAPLHRQHIEAATKPQKPPLAHKPRKILVHGSPLAQVQKLLGGQDAAFRQSSGGLKNMRA